MTTETKPIRSRYAEVEKMQRILHEFIAELPARAGEIQSQLSLNQMDRLARTAHQLRGTGGGYGFQEMTDRAAQVEQAVKDQQPLESIALQVSGLIEYLRRIEGYCIDAERAPAMPDSAGLRNFFLASLNSRPGHPSIDAMNLSTA